MTPSEEYRRLLMSRADWPERLPPAFYGGLEKLNRGAYYACHETLEALWIPERRTVREVYQGVLQVAVGCYHLTARANWRGAVNKLDDGARRLERAGLGEEAGDAEGYGIYGVAWGEFLTAADRLQTHLRTLRAENVAAFDPALLPTVRYRRSGGSGGQEG